MSIELSHFEQNLAFTIESEIIPHRRDGLSVPSEDASRVSTPTSVQSAEQSRPRSQQSRNVTSSGPSPPLSPTVTPNEAGALTRQGYSRISVWSYELFCGLLALSSFVAIIAAAHAYSGDSLPNLPYGLSINTILAIFTAIIKASIGLVVSEGLGHLKWVQLEKPQFMSAFDIYDQASRGPFGAVILLGKFGWRLRHSVSSIGAIVLVLLLPIDPLVQQIVRFYSCQRHATAVPATISRARIFDETIDGLFFSSYGAEGNYSGTMESAISQAIFNPGQNRPFWSCATGNCSFAEEFSSLGFCSSCVDAWDRVVGQSVNESQWFEPSRGDSAVWGRNVSTVWTLPGIQKNATISEGYISYEAPRIEPGFTVKNDSGFVVTERTTVWPFDYGFSMAVDQKSTTEASESTIYIIFIRNRGAERGDLPQHAAFSCSLSPCVRTYHASDVRRDKLEEAVDPLEQSKWGWAEEAVSPEFGYWAIADLHCLGDRKYEKSVLRGIGYEFQESTRWLPYNISFQYVPGSYFPGQWIQKPRPIDAIAPDARKYYEKWITPDDVWLPEAMPAAGQYVLNQTVREIVPKECIYQFSSGVRNQFSVPNGLDCQG